MSRCKQYDYSQLYSGCPTMKHFQKNLVVPHRRNHHQAWSTRYQKMFSEDVHFFADPILQITNDKFSSFRNLFFSGIDHATIFLSFFFFYFVALANTGRHAKLKTVAFGNILCFRFCRNFTTEHIQLILGFMGMGYWSPICHNNKINRSIIGFRKIWVVVCDMLQLEYLYPFFRPKYGIFPFLFQNWPADPIRTEEDVKKINVH